MMWKVFEIMCLPCPRKGKFNFGLSCLSSRVCSFSIFSFHDAAVLGWMEERNLVHHLSSLIDFGALFLHWNPAKVLLWCVCPGSYF